jgi:hypothetical protein
MSEGVVEFFLSALILLVVGACLWHLGRQLVQSYIDRPRKN